MLFMLAGTVLAQSPGVSPSVTTPDKVETRLGTFEFKDGVPSAGAALGQATGDDLYGIVRQYSDLGVHRVGTPVDAQTIEWFTKQLENRVAKSSGSRSRLIASKAQALPQSTAGKSLRCR